MKIAFLFSEMFDALNIYYLIVDQLLADMTDSKLIDANWRIALTSEVAQFYTVNLIQWSFSW